MALVLANAAAQVTEFVGMPECRIPLVQAATYIALAPKSNATIKAIDAAMEDVRTHACSRFLYTSATPIIPAPSGSDTAPVTSMPTITLAAGWPRTTWESRRRIMNRSREGWRRSWRVREDFKTRRRAAGNEEPSCYCLVVRDAAEPHCRNTCWFAMLMPESIEPTIPRSPLVGAEDKNVFESFSAANHRLRGVP